LGLLQQAFLFFWGHKQQKAACALCKKTVFLMLHPGKLGNGAYRRLSGSTLDAEKNKLAIENSDGIVKLNAKALTADINYPAAFARFPYIVVAFGFQGQGKTQKLAVLFTGIAINGLKASGIHRQFRPLNSYACIHARDMAVSLNQNQRHAY
jgi:hypothetical protein